MNRSILIVICDFLISAMLSMSSGMLAPDQLAGGTSGGGRSMVDNSTISILLDELQTRRVELMKAREELLVKQQENFSKNVEVKVKKLTEELVDSQLKIKELESKLKSTDKNTGVLTPAEIKKKLDAEMRSKLLLDMELQDTRKKLINAQEILLSGSRTNEVVKQRFADTLSKLLEKERQLDKMNMDLGAANANLKQKEQQLEEAQEDIANLNKDVKTANEKASGLLYDLSYTKGKLNTTERDLAESKDYTNRIRQEAIKVEIERLDAQRRLSSAQEVLKKAVADLSTTKKNLNIVKEQAQKFDRELIVAKSKIVSTEAKLDAAQGELKSTKTQIDIAALKLKNNIFELYDDAAVTLNIDIDSDAFMSEIKGGGKYFFPVIEIANKNYIPGSLEYLAGAGSTPLMFNKITKLSYGINSPKIREQINLDGSLLVLDADPRVALLEVPTTEDIKPLKVVGVDVLKKTGLDDLYLFKSGGLGKNSVSLTGRCSLDLAGGGEYLFIRNGGRISSNIVKAEAGDLILTKQGEMVGVVIANSGGILSAEKEAKCYIFPITEKLYPTSKIPLKETKQGEYFKTFGELVMKFLIEGDKRSFR